MEAVSKNERNDAIKKIVKLYETELGDVIKVGKRFNPARLPSIVQMGIKLATAKSPAFSNIAAASTVNLVYMHLIGQLRPVINDIVYSNDMLGLNYYGIVISASGSGKDSTYSTINSALSTATNLIKDEADRIELVRATTIALKVARKENPNIQENELTVADINEYKRDAVPIVAESRSTVGGLTSILNNLQHRDLGSLVVLNNEFGLALKQNSTVQEILELLGSIYDMGNVQSAQFKTVELRESAIEGLYPNALLHSSPKIIFGNEKVRDTISNLFHTMLARRSWFSMPSEDESIENNVIASDTTIDQVRAIAAQRRVDISTASSEIDNLSTEVVRTLLASEENRILRFSEEAQKLYVDYFEYGSKRAELLEDSSIIQTEMNGRAFKTARLAGLWSLMSNTNVISAKVLASAIYYAEYNSKYLERFVSLTTAKAFILLGDMFRDGKMTEISLDSAITNGYISRVSNDFKELIDPMNSYLRHIGIVQYDTDTRIFKYTPFKHVEEDGEFGMSYSKVPGLSKDDRGSRLAGFDHYRMLNMTQLKKIVSTDTIYNVFKYRDAVNKDGDMIKHNRNRDNIESSTKLLTIDVDESTIPISEMHAYLSEFKHIISTTSDVNNKHKFRILLPINVEVEGTNPQLYKCIMKHVCEELLVKFDPTSSNNVQPIYGYEGAEVFSKDEGILYDVADIITDCTTGEEMTLVTREMPKTASGKKKLVDSMMANANKVFDYVPLCKKGQGSLSLSRAAMHMRDSGFNREQFTQVIQYLNSLWTSPMDDDRINKLLEQYIDSMQ